MNVCCFEIVKLVLPTIDIICCVVQINLRCCVFYCLYSVRTRRAGHTARWCRSLPQRPCKPRSDQISAGAAQREPCAALSTECVQTVLTTASCGRGHYYINEPHKATLIRTDCPSVIKSCCFVYQTVISWSFCIIVYNFWTLL